MRKIPKPTIDEYAPYTSMYINLLPNDGLVLDHMQANLEIVKAFVRTFPAQKLIEPCTAGAWTIKEILVHVIDDERIYCYRALRFARNDKTVLPGFEQDDYVPYSLANERDLADILQEYTTVRQATLTFFNSLTDAALTRVGYADNKVMSVQAAVYHIAGHELHHLNSVRENYT